MGPETGRAPVITLLTDFGRTDAYAGVLHGVIAGIAPAARVVDLCHDVPPQDVRAGAFLLLTAYAFFPAGTVHVAVVDPGVGTERAIVAVRAGGYHFVGPDNGLLRWAVDAAGGIAAAVRVEAAPYRLPVVSHTFHGRDVMAPAAAHLARGVPLGDLGPPVAALAGEPFPRPREEAGALRGEVLYVDHFGNCITNLPPVPGAVRVAGRTLRRGQTYASGRPRGGGVAVRGVEPTSRMGEPIALEGSAGFLELAVPGGSAGALLGVAPGAEVILHLAAHG